MDRSKGKHNILGMILTLLEIGQVVARQRKAAGLRQIDLAARSGLSRATIDALKMAEHAISASLSLPGSSAC